MAPIDLDRHDVIGVQIHKPNAITIPQRLEPEVRKAIKCVIERGALSDDDGSFIARTHEVENGP